MTRTAETVRTLMRAADPLPPQRAAECESMMETDLAELVGRVRAGVDEPEADVWDLTVAAHDPARPIRSQWAVPAVAAAVLATAVAITVAVAAGRDDHGAPAGDLSSAAHRSLTSQQSAEAALRSVAAEKARAQAAAEARLAARVCADEVDRTLKGMTGAYQHGNTSKAAALHWLQSVHPSSSRLYARDARAFDDWLARGGPAGRITVESAVARACIQ